MDDFPVAPGFGAAPPPPLPPSQPSPVSHRGRSRAFLFALGGLVIAGLIAIAAWAFGPDEHDDLADPVPTSAPSATDPPPTEPPATTGSDPTEPPATTADPGSGDAEFDSVIDELIAFVEAERGLEFVQRPEVVVLPDDEFVTTYQNTVAEDFAENAEDVEHYTGIYQALRLLPDDVTLQEAYDAFGSAGVAGFYDPETDELYVRGGELTPFVKIVVAHELVHALDDQHFDLDRPEYDDRDDEISFGFSAMVEGNARYIENRYRATLSASEEAEATAEELSMSGDVDFSKFTLTFIELQLLPYGAGEVLIGHLLDAGGQAAVDAAIADPPVTSEQVLHPDRFDNGEAAATVDPPPADGEVEQDGVFGAGVFQVIFAEELGQGDAEDAVDGWAGDWFVSWTDGDRTCLRVDVLLDSAGAADGFEDALDEWASSRDDVERLDDETVRLTACE